jgi:zinc transport system substrate-binding protein
MSGLSPEAEISPSKLAQLVDDLTDIGVRYVLIEPNVSPRNAETLAREINATLLELHPLESLTINEIEDGEDYFSIMSSNLKTLQSALECV